jgi:hypothetical protein
MDVLAPLALAEQREFIRCYYRGVVLSRDGDAVTQVISMTVSQQHRVKVAQVVRSYVRRGIAGQERIDNQSAVVSGNLKACVTMKR